MSLFQCPLCGKFNSYARYDPRSFDDDIYGADVSGRGKGRGFSFSEKYSLLEDEHLSGLIVKRSRRILHFTEGEEPPPPGSVKELVRINKDWVAWGEEAQKAIAQKDSQINLLNNEVTKLNGWVNALNEKLRHTGPSIHAVRAEQLQRENDQWRVVYTSIEAKNNSQATQIRSLQAINQRLNAKINAYEEASVDDDDSAAAAEMEELLDRINDSSNTDFDTLSDAVDWLLEG